MSNMIGRPELDGAETTPQPGDPDVHGESTSAEWGDETSPERAARKVEAQPDNSSEQHPSGADMEPDAVGSEGAGDGESDHVDELSEVRAQLAAAEERAGIAEERVLHALADLENTRKRARREVESARRFGVESLARSLLAVVDNLDRALEFMESAQKLDQATRSIVEGVELTRKSLLAALNSSGIEPVDPKNELFDPALHNAMTMIPNTGKEPGVIVEVLRKGYTLQGRLLREAEVVVAAAGDSGAAKDDPDV